MSEQMQADQFNGDWHKNALLWRAMYYAQIETQENASESLMNAVKEWLATREDTA